MNYTHAVIKVKFHVEPVYHIFPHTAKEQFMERQLMLRIQEIIDTKRCLRGIYIENYETTTYEEENR